jgi:glycosyltransferase involved in cell wall biosynthesis
MKIAFDHQIFGWQEYGGISRYACELAGQLATSYRQEVKIISPIHITNYLEDAPKDLGIVGIRVPAFKRIGRLYREINSLLAPSAMRRYDPDIVHETYYAKKGISSGRAKVVLTVYDMIHERFPEYFSPLSPTRQEKAAAVRRADHVICISEQTRADLIDILGINPEKTSVVHLGFSLTKKPLTNNEGKKLSRPYILYVGNRSGHKNFAVLLSAYATSQMLKNEFDLICMGGGGFSLKETELIKKLHIPLENIKQVSGGDEVLGQYYSEARAFVYPSLYEGFGIPPLEAMSFNCPVVCSNMSSIPEVVGDAAEYFDPADENSMKISIERTVSNDVLRQELITKGKRRAASFSWERCAFETLNVYRKVLLQK